MIGCNGFKGWCLVIDGVGWKLKKGSWEIGCGGRNLLFWVRLGERCKDRGDVIDLDNW